MQTSEVHDCIKELYGSAAEELKTAFGIDARFLSEEVRITSILCDTTILCDTAILVEMQVGDAHLEFAIISDGSSLACVGVGVDGETSHKDIPVEELSELFVFHGLHMNAKQAWAEAVADVAEDKLFVEMDDAVGEASDQPKQLDSAFAVEPGVEEGFVASENAKRFAQTIVMLAHESIEELDSMGVYAGFTWKVVGDEVVITIFSEGLSKTYAVSEANDVEEVFVRTNDSQTKKLFSLEDLFDFFFYEALSFTVLGTPIKPETEETIDSEVSTVSKTGGVKGEKLAKFSLIPTAALTALAERYGHGIGKYELRNWERGYNWSLSYDALHRHLNAFWSGEEYDPEFPTSHHLAAVMFHAAALLHYTEYPELYSEFDDRPVYEVERHG